MISDRLKTVILAELHLDNYPLQETTSAFEVPGWDSLQHVTILAAVEKEFGIRLKTMEVLRLQNLGELQSLINRKVAA